MNVYGKILQKSLNELCLTRTRFDDEQRKFKKLSNVPVELNNFVNQK